MMVLVPLRTGAGQNDREHFRAKARRVKAERHAVAWLLALHKPPAGPVTVTLTRISPGQGLDAHDNLRGSLKAPVDQVAEWLGRDDADPSITWKYDQRRGKPGEWMVAIEVSADGAHGVGDRDDLQGRLQQRGVSRLVDSGRAPAGQNAVALDDVDHADPAPIELPGMGKQGVAVGVDKKRHPRSVARPCQVIKKHKP